MSTRQSMGFPFVPGTFPTIGVYGFMKRAGIDTSWGEVDRLWDAYYLATVVEGIPPFNHDAGGKNAAALIDYMTTKTQIPRNTVAGWLNALSDEVAANGREYYLDPVTSKKASEAGNVSISHPLDAITNVAKSAGEAVGGFLKPTAEPLTNMIKWAAVLVVGGAVIYGVYHGSKLLKAKRKRKG
jgi:hypothetical protein